MNIDKQYQKVSDFIKSWTTRRFLFGLIILQIILHLPIIDLPPMGQHTWRQTMGLATARNYYEEGNSFLYPSQDVRAQPGDDGVIYFEFPLIYWLIGQSYHLTGFSHVNGRLVMLLMGILLIIGSYKMIRALGFNEVRARWYVFFLSCAPVFFYYSITVSPNLPALTWFVWGIALILPRLNRERWDLVFWLGLLFLILGTVSKATYLFFGLPVAYLFLNQYLKNRNRMVLGVSLVFGFIVILANGFLFFHARTLFDAAASERQYYAVLKPDFFPESFNAVYPVIRTAVVEWFLQMYVNTAAIPIFLTGCIMAIKNKKWKSCHQRFWILWLVSFLVFFTLFFVQFRAHAYYQTPMLMFAALGTSYGVGFFLKHKKWRFVAVFLIVFVPVVMVGRVGHRWISAKQVPVELLERVGEFQAVIPESDRVLIIHNTSPVTFLYYLHRKGVVIPGSFTEADILKYRKHGFRYVITRSDMTYPPSLKNHVLLHTRIGDFSVLTFKPQEP